MFPSPPLSARRPGQPRATSNRRALSARRPTGANSRRKSSTRGMKKGSPSPYSMQPFKLQGRRRLFIRPRAPHISLAAFNSAVSHSPRGPAFRGESPMLVQNAPKLQDVRRKRQQTQEEMQRMQNRINKLKVKKSKSVLPLCRTVINLCPPLAGT